MGLFEFSFSSMLLCFLAETPPRDLCTPPKFRQGSPLLEELSPLKIFDSYEREYELYFSCIGEMPGQTHRGNSCYACCPIARHRTIKDIEENNWSHGTNVRRQPCFWSHDFDFLHNPIVYGVARLLYGVALSDSVLWSTRFSNGTNSPSYTLLYHQNFIRVCP